MMLELYPMINGTNMGSDLTYLFTYTDSITNGFATIMICLAFFFTVFIGSLVAQQRYTTNMRIETSLLAASFVTLGLEIILMQKNLVQGWLFSITLLITVLSFIWVTYGTSETG